MSFVQAKLDRSFNQTRGIFDKYVYSPENGDTSQDVVTAGYFNDSRFLLDPEWDGGIIEMKLADGYFIGVVSGGSISVIYQVGGSSGGVSIISYGDFITTPTLVLTTTPQLVTGWSQNIAPVGITESNGRFTFSSNGVYKIDLERVYGNNDPNPTAVVIVTIDIYKNGQLEITRSGPLSSATSNNEPSISAFTTPFLEVVSEDDYYEIYVSASDGGQNPDGSILAIMKFVADRSHDLPV